MRTLLKSLSPALAGLALWGAAATAAEWPTEKPITVVMPFAAGSDYLARLIAGDLEKRLGQTVVFENRPGAGGAMGTAWGARQAPDGYTLIMAYPGPAANFANTYKDLPYKPLEDFEHIAQVAVGDMVLVVRKDFPGETLADVIAYMKANPGKVSAGNNGVGSYGHMIELALAEAAGVEMKLVPYKGSPQIVTDMLSGSVDMSIDYLGDTYMKQIQAGNVKPIAVVSAQRARVLPDIPTFKEGGVDLSAAAWSGIMAPKGTPRPIVDAVNKAIGEYLAEPEAIEKFTKIGQTPAHTTPEAFHDIVVREEALWRDIIHKYGITNQ